MRTEPFTFGVRGPAEAFERLRGDDPVKAYDETGGEYTVAGGRRVLAETLPAGQLAEIEAKAEGRKP